MKLIDLLKKIRNNSNNISSAIVLSSTSLDEIDYDKLDIKEREYVDNIVELLDLKKIIDLDNKTKDISNEMVNLVNYLVKLSFDIKENMGIVKLKEPDKANEIVIDSIIGNSKLEALKNKFKNIKRNYELILIALIKKLSILEEKKNIFYDDYHEKYNRLNDLIDNRLLGLTIIQGLEKGIINIQTTSELIKDLISENSNNISKEEIIKEINKRFDKANKLFKYLFNEENKSISDLANMEVKIDLYLANYIEKIKDDFSNVLSISLSDENILEYKDKIILCDLINRYDRGKYISEEERKEFILLKYKMIRKMKYNSILELNEEEIEIIKKYFISKLDDLIKIVNSKKMYKYVSEKLSEYYKDIKEADINSIYDIEELLIKYFECKDYLDYKEYFRSIACKYLCNNYNLYYTSDKDLEEIETLEIIDSSFFSKIDPLILISLYITFDFDVYDEIHHIHIGKMHEVTVTNYELSSKNNFIGDVSSNRLNDIVKVFINRNSVFSNFYFTKFPKLNHVIIQEGVTEIGKDAFRVCRNLEEVVLPSTIKEIGVGAFSCCFKLRKIVIPEGVTEIGSFAFNGCRNLEEVELPSTIKKIGSSAFNECRNLEEVELPSTIKKIGESAFSWCSKLRKIVIPEGVEEIGAFAFCCCENLEEVELPSTIKKIGEEAFYRCPELRKIVIPEGVEEIGASAFSNCKNLKELYVPRGCKIDASTINKSNNCSIIWYNSLDEVEYQSVVGVVKKLVREAK